MSINYKQILLNLKKELPYLNELAIIKNDFNIIYSTEKWNNESFSQFVSDWSATKIQDLTFNGINFKKITSTSDRIIALNQEEGYLVGVKDRNWFIIAQIESDGIIPFTITELSRLLASLRLNKPLIIREKLLKEKDIENEDKLKTLKTKDNQKSINKNNTGIVPFSARLMAYYRSLEINRKNSLIIDPLATRLAGDLKSYFKKHIRYSEMDYPIVRSYFIENALLTPWCREKESSQIMLLGAGLDTRAYRFKPLELNNHAIFELDFPQIITYKESVLFEEQPLCSLKRIPADLTTEEWLPLLKESGFSKNLPTIWILEGLVYYIELHLCIKLLQNITRLSNEESQIFIDLMQRSRWLKSDDYLYLNSSDTINGHFRWGMDIKDVARFFWDIGWDVKCDFADEYDQGRDVGQKAMVFVHGKLKSHVECEERYKK